MKKPILKIAFFLLPVLLVLSCDKIPWPEEDREVFIENCIVGAEQNVADSLRADINIKEFCTCVQQKMEAEYSIQEVIKQEYQVSEYVKFNRECLEEHRSTNGHKH